MKELPCFYCTHWRRLRRNPSGMNGIGFWQNSSCMIDETNHNELCRVDLKIINGRCKDFYRATGMQKFKCWFNRLNLF